MAKQSSPRKQYLLGKLYASTWQDDRAVFWWRQAAESGYPDAQYHLGCLHEQGEIVRQDDFLAALWYRKAAQQGHKLAQFNLGQLYAEGRGVPRIPAQAAYWWQQAARQGSRLAQQQLRLLEARGDLWKWWPSS